MKSEVKLRRKEVKSMTMFEITTIILLSIALSAGYAFKKHNKELLKKEREEQKKYYQYVKENWMYIDNDNGSKNE